MLLALLLLRVVWPAGFARWVSGPWRRSRLRRRYRRRWSVVIDLCDLTKTRPGVVLTPKLMAVQVGVAADRLLVAMVAGQALADWERACPELASSFGARSARVWADRPGSLWLELLRGDALAEVVPALPVPAAPDLRRVVVGVMENGAAWVLAVLGTHLFIGGVSSAGKGSVLWSLLRGLAVAIRDGLVAVWAVDPKGGMELGFGRPLFARFAADSTAAMVELLEDAVLVMDARCARLAGVTRLHAPTVVEPMILVVIDELSTLTAYEPDTKLRSRATAAISALLARGRAAGVVVVAAAQDPRKEVVGFRSLFPTKVALRLDTPAQVDMVLGEGMHQMGAEADRISPSSPGVGYVTVEGVREPVRVRAAWVSDDDILTMAADYPAPAPMPAEVRHGGPDVRGAA